jgi:hypothetical protein
VNRVLSERERCVPPHAEPAAGTPGWTPAACDHTASLWATSGHSASTDPPTWRFTLIHKSHLLVIRSMPGAPGPPKMPTQRICLVTWSGDAPPDKIAPYMTLQSDGRKGVMFTANSESHESALLRPVVSGSQISPERPKRSHRSASDESHVGKSGRPLMKLSP